MYPLDLDDILSVSVGKLDLSALEPGQVVQIVTDDGDLWITRTNFSEFHDQGEGGRATSMMVAGTGDEERNPLKTSMTRRLEPGKKINVRTEGGRNTYVQTVLHILLPVH